MSNSSKYTAKAYTLENQHIAIINQLAKDQGDSGASAALRRIIDEWHEFKSRQLVDSRPQYETEVG